MEKQSVIITIDPQSGFCFGVTEAIEKAERALQANGELYCLGEIVHNDEEIARLEKAGMQTIAHKQLGKLKEKTILFRAHGEPPSSYQAALQNNNTIIDASCPIIKKLQKQIKQSWEEGKQIVIFGKPDHPEVIGLNGQISNEGIIIQKFEDIPLERLSNNISLYSQTTQSLEAFYDIVNALKNTGKTVEIHDTICRKVSNRQPQLRAFASKHQLIIFVGGKNSSNGKVLFEVCKSVNPNSFFVSHIDEIKSSWLDDITTVGITGATSTPKWLMEDIRDHFLKLCFTKNIVDSRVCSK